MSSPPQAAEAGQPADAAVPALDRIAARLADSDVADDVPLAQRAELFGRLHDELRSALAEIDGA